MKTTLNAEHADRSSLVGAQAVAREFLTDALPAVQARGRRQGRARSVGRCGWEAEADVWQPNPTLKSLGIETGRPVLDHNHYLVRLDSMLNVLEYELKESFQ